MKTTNEAIHSATDWMDDINRTLEAASAIVDCAKVLTSLIQMPTVHGVELATGNGWAYGFELRTHSLSNALEHALDLMDEARAASNQIHTLATKSTVQPARGAPH